MKKAVYAGSFDPVTNGHLWVIEESAQIFDELIIALGTNAEKNYFFSRSQRYALIQALTKKYTNVKIMDLSNDLIVDYAKNVGAGYLVRGIRNASDFEYEQRILNVNTDIDSTIKTIFLISPQQYTNISSNMIKGLMRSKKWEKIVEKYVPNLVLEQLIIKNKALNES